VYFFFEYTLFFLYVISSCCPALAVFAVFFRREVSKGTCSFGRVRGEALQKGGHKKQGCALRPTSPTGDQ
jgi:hypothetical protein